GFSRTIGSSRTRRPDGCGRYRSRTRPPARRGAVGFRGRMPRLKGLIVLDRGAYDSVYAPRAAAELAERVELVAAPQTRRSLAADTHLLSDVDVIFSGWGSPKMDAAFLAAAPNLK